MICDQLCEYFSSKNLLCSQQYGFRKNSSTELAALEVIDRLLTQLDGQLIPINFYLDLSKAFDSLNHNILLNKLSYYGVTHMANTLLRSYLSNRKQYVMVGDVRSSTQPITSGVPQESVIGPFLFNVLINDIIKSSDKFNFILYADDTILNSTLDVFGDTVNEIQLAIMMDLQKISKWLDHFCTVCINDICYNKIYYLIIFGGLVIAALFALIRSPGHTHVLLTNIINTIVSSMIQF